MRSYFSIGEIDERVRLVKGELELIDVAESNGTDFIDRPTTTDVCLQLDMINDSIDKIEEGDIIVVEHNTEDVLSIYGKDDDEKSKRIGMLKSIMRR